MKILAVRAYFIGRKVLILSDYAIRVKGLVKKYGEFTAVDGIDFDVQKGHLFAFLGPNGAGKSTTINIICTLLEQTAGEVSVSGFSIEKDRAKVRDQIGVVFQDNMLDKLLTIRENLFIRGGLYGKSKSELNDRMKEIAEIMGLEDILNKPYGKLSGGQKRRAEIARALMNNPQILILDEPTTGLDPQTRMNVWSIISSLQKTLHMTVFLTTHYMEEAANADCIAIIDHGRIIAQGTPQELKASYSSDVLRLTPIELEAVGQSLAAHGYRYQCHADTLVIPVKNSLEAYALLKEFEGQYTSFEVISGTIDDVFVNSTGHAIREDGLT